jgi:hypothetical protein
VNISSLEVLLSAFGGSLLTVICSRIGRKISILEFTSTTFVVGTTIKDPNFGDTEVSHGGAPVGSVTYTTLKVRNTSSKDFKNMKMQVFCGPKNYFANVQGLKIGSLTVFKFSPECVAQLSLGGLVSCVEYDIPVFNRNEELEFKALAINPSSGDAARSWLDLDEAGIRLRLASEKEQFLGAPKDASAVLGLALTAALVGFTSFSQHSLPYPAWVLFVTMWLAGALAIIPGALVIRGLRQIKELLK